MELNLNFDDYTENGTSRALSPGWYAATVEEQVDEISQAGNRQLTLTLSLEKGGRVKSWYGVFHPTESSAEIAKAALVKLAKASGLASLADTRELVGRKVEIKLEPDGDFNKVKDSRSLSTSPKSPQMSNALPPKMGHEVSRESPPWPTTE